MMLLLQVLAGIAVCAQDGSNVEWLCKIDAYSQGPTMRQHVVHDRYRNNVILSMSYLDQYVSADSGETWRRLFHPAFQLIPSLGRFDALDNGTYVVSANFRINAELDGIHNVVSTDGGTTWRLLIADTAQYPFPFNEERQPTIVQPRWLAYHSSMLNVGCEPGIYVSDNNGSTYRRYATPHSNYRQIRSPGDSVILWTSVQEDDAAAQGKQYAWHLGRDESPFLTTIPNLPVGGTYLYAIIRLRNGAVFYTDTVNREHRGMDGGSRSDLQDVYYANSLTDTFSLCGLEGVQGLLPPVSAMLRMTDTSVVGITADGRILLFGQSGPMGRVLFAPQEGEGSCAATHFSVHNGRLLVHVAQHAKTMDQHGLYVLYDSGTERVQTFPAKGMLAQWRTPFNPTLIPLTASRWLIAPVESGGGAVIQTTDAGTTWSPLNIADRGTDRPKTATITDFINNGDGSFELRLSNALWLRLRKDGRVYVEKIRSRMEYDEVKDAGTTQELGPMSFNQAMFHPGRYGVPHLSRTMDGTLTMGGSVLTRWSEEGNIIDTILPRRAVFAKRHSATRLSAGADSLWFSFDNGKEWIYVGQGLPTGAKRRSAIEAFPRPGIGDVEITRNGTVLLGFRGIRDRTVTDILTLENDSIHGGLYRSTDDGNSWQMVDTLTIPKWSNVSSIRQLGDGSIVALRNLTANRHSGGLVWLYAFASSHFAIVRSTDDGSTWKDVLTSNYTSGMARTFEVPGATYVVTPGGVSWRSTNYGRTWSEFDVAAEFGSTALTSMEYSSDGYLYFTSDVGLGRKKIGISSLNNEAIVSHCHPNVRIQGGRMNIEAECAYDRVHVYDMLGRCLYSGSPTSDYLLSGLRPGIYIVCFVGVMQTSTTTVYNGE